MPHRDWNRQTHRAFLTLFAGFGVFSALASAAPAALSFDDQESCKREGRDYLEPYLRWPGAFAQVHAQCESCTASELPHVGLPKLPIEDFSKLNPKCVHSSLIRDVRYNESTEAFYGFCEKDPSKHPRKCESRNSAKCSWPAPCVTETHVRFVYEAYMESMKCMRMDPKLLFPVVNHESHFRMNVMSQSGAWGAVQMTGQAIREVNDKASIEELKERPECAKLKFALNPLPNSLEETGDYSFICDRIEPPAGVIRNFIYAAQLMELYAAQADAFLKRAASRVLQADLDRVRQDLIWSFYNSGPSAVLSLLESFMEERLKGRKVSLKAFRSEFLPYASTHLDASRLASLRARVGSESQPSRKKGLRAQITTILVRRTQIRNYPMKLEREAKAVEQAAEMPGACTL